MRYIQLFFKAGVFKILSTLMRLLSFLSTFDFPMDPGLLCHGQSLECIEYIHDDFLPVLEQTMIGMTDAERITRGEKSPNAGEEGVPEELKAFGKECA